MATAKQKAAVAKLVECSRTDKTEGEALIEAGYAPNTAIKPTQVKNSKGFQEAAEPFVKQMEKERQRLIDSMRIKNLESVEYKDHVKAIDLLTKNMQLLTGGATERSDMTVNIERVKEIEGAFSDL